MSYFNLYNSAVGQVFSYYFQDEILKLKQINPRTFLSGKQQRQNYKLDVRERERIKKICDLRPDEILKEIYISLSNFNWGGVWLKQKENIFSFSVC